MRIDSKETEANRTKRIEGVVTSKIKGIVSKLNESHQKFEDPDFGPTEADETGRASLFQTENKPSPDFPDPDSIVWQRPTFDDGKFSDSEDGGEGEEEEEEEDDDFGFSSKKRGPDVWCKHGKLFIDGSCSNDVIQGAVGDCWFISALAVLGAKEKLLEQCFFKTDSFKEYGLFIVRFFKDCQVIYVIIDDRIPVRESSGQVIFAKCQNPNELWVPLMEKAYAKLHGCYAALARGYTHYGLADLTGYCPRLIGMKPNSMGYTEDISEEVMKETLVKYLDKWQCLLGTNIQPRPRGANEKAEIEVGDGLLSGHAYSLMAVGKIRLSDAYDASGKKTLPPRVKGAKGDLESIKGDDGKEGSELTLVRLRNPWGNHEWSGMFGDSTEERAIYDKEIRRIFATDNISEVFGVNERDGTFVMRFKDWFDKFHHVFAAVNFPKEWKGQRRKGVFNGQTGGSRTMDTWYSNPQISFSLKKPADVFIGLYINDSRLTLGAKFDADPLYKTRMAFDMVRKDFLKEWKGFKTMTHAVSAKDDKIITPQPPYFWTTTQLEKENLPAGDYFIVPSLIDRGTSGSFFFCIFASEDFTVDGGVDMSTRLDSFKPGGPEEEFAAPTTISSKKGTISINQLFEKKEQLRDKLVEESIKQKITYERLKDSFKEYLRKGFDVPDKGMGTSGEKKLDVKLTLSIVKFKRHLMDLGFTLADLPDDELAVFDDDDDDLNSTSMDICPENFLSFFKHGLDQRFSELKAVTAPVPDDDAIYKLPNLEGTIEVNVVAARDLRKVTTWFSEASPALGDDLSDENGASKTNEIVYSPRPCVSYDQAKAAKLLDARKTKLRQLYAEMQEKMKGEVAARKAEKGMGASSPKKNAESHKTDAAKQKRDDEDVKSVAATAFSLATSRRPPVTNAAPLHSDPEIAKAEEDRMKALNMRRRRHSQDTGKSAKEEDSMLRIKTKVRSRVKRSICDKDSSDVRAYIGVTDGGRPFYEVNHKDLYDDKCKLGGLWSDLLDSVFIICSSKGARKAAMGSALLSFPEKGEFKSEHFENIDKINSSSAASNLAGGAEVTKNTSSKTSTISIAKTPRYMKGTAAISTGSTISEVKAKLESSELKESKQVYYEVYQRLLAIPLVAQSEIEGENAVDESSSSIAQDSSTVLKKLFRKFDSNSNGTISLEEFTATLQSMNINANAQETQTLFNRFETRKLDGNIDINEFFNFFSERICSETFVSESLSGNTLKNKGTDSRESHAFVHVLSVMYKRLHAAVEQMKDKHDFLPLELLESMQSERSAVSSSTENVIETPRNGYGKKDVLPTAAAAAVLDGEDTKDTPAEAEAAAGAAEEKAPSQDSNAEDALTALNTEVNAGKHAITSAITPAIAINVIPENAFFNNFLIKDATANVKTYNKILDHMIAKDSKANTKDKEMVVTAEMMARVQRAFGENMSAFMDFVTKKDVNVGAMVDNFRRELVIAIETRSKSSKGGATASASASASHVTKIWMQFAPSPADTVSVDTLTDYFCQCYEDQVAIASAPAAAGATPAAKATEKAVKQQEEEEEEEKTNGDEKKEEEDDKATTAGTSRPVLQSYKSIRLAVDTFKEKKEEHVATRSKETRLLCRIIADEIAYSSWNRPDIVSSRSSSGGVLIDAISMSGFEAFLMKEHVDSIERKCVFIIKSYINYANSVVRLMTRVFVHKSKKEIVVVAYDPISDETMKMFIDADVSAMPIGPELRDRVEVKRLIADPSDKTPPAEQGPMKKFDTFPTYDWYSTPVEDQAISDLLSRVRVLECKDGKPSLLLTEDPKYVSQVKALVDAAANLPFFTVVNELTLLFAVDASSLSKASICRAVFGNLRQSKSLYKFLVNTISTLKVVLVSYNSGLRVSMNWTEMLAYLHDYRNPFVSLQLLPAEMQESEYNYRPSEGGSQAFTSEDAERGNGEVLSGAPDLDGGSHPHWSAGFKLDYRHPKITYCKVQSTEVAKMRVDGATKYVLVMVRCSDKAGRFLTVYDSRSATEYQCGMSDKKFPQAVEGRPSEKVDRVHPFYDMLYGQPPQGQSIKDFVDGQSIKDFVALLGDAAESNLLVLGPAITPRLVVAVYNQRKSQVEMLGSTQISLSSVISGLIEREQWATLSYLAKRDDKTVGINAGEVKIELSYKSKADSVADSYRKGKGGGKRAVAGKTPAGDQSTPKEAVEVASNAKDNAAAATAAVKEELQKMAAELTDTKEKLKAETERQRVAAEEVHKYREVATDIEATLAKLLAENEALKKQVAAAAVAVEAKEAPKKDAAAAAAVEAKEAPKKKATAAAAVEAKEAPKKDAAAATAAEVKKEKKDRPEEGEKEPTAPGSPVSSKVRAASAPDEAAEKIQRKFRDDLEVKKAAAEEKQKKDEAAATIQRKVKERAASKETSSPVESGDLPAEERPLKQEPKAVKVKGEKKAGLGGSAEQKLLPDMDEKKVGVGAEKGGKAALSVSMPKVGSSEASAKGRAASTLPAMSGSAPSSPERLQNKADPASPSSPSRQSIDWATLPLPKYWVRKLDPDTSRHYYQDNLHKTTQWHHPLQPRKEKGRGRPATAGAQPEARAAPKEAWGEEK